MDRYTEISRCDERIWGDRCPVMAERWCIWRDNETGEATGQVQILSLVMPRVIGVNVHLECYGAGGVALGAGTTGSRAPACASEWRPPFPCPTPAP